MSDTRRFGSRIRDWLERVKLEAPAVVRDLPDDVFDLLGRPAVHLPVPPRRLRAAVGRTSAREEYLQAGAVAAAEILGAFSRCASPGASYESWLDFGCGPGRLSRYLTLSRVCTHLLGVDVDEEAIAWASKHIPGASFRVSSEQPPLPLPTSSIDVAVAASVFTHFSEAQQLRWLDELARVLRPGGLLLASTHPIASLEAVQGALVAPGEVSITGFQYLPSSKGYFNESAAFHSRSYLEKQWSARFLLRMFLERGLFQFQDLGVWERMAERA
jgi:SAM-dependent methyltransferase